MALRAFLHFYGTENKCLPLCKQLLVLRFSPSKKTVINRQGHSNAGL
jgi:hypothetical protein